MSDIQELKPMDEKIKERLFGKHLLPPPKWYVFLMARFFGEKTITFDSGWTLVGYLWKEKFYVTKGIKELGPLKRIKVTNERNYRHKTRY